MKFIKLGAAYINMDLVTDIWVDKDQVSVFLAVPMMYTAIPFHGTSNAITTRTLQFSGADAEALLDWLENKSKAKDITPPSSKKKDAPHDDAPLAAEPADLVPVDDQANGVQYSD